MVMFAYKKKIFLNKSCFMVGLFWLHWNKNPIYAFLFWELRRLSPNIHIHVSVSNLYVPRIGPHISCSRIARLIMGIYKSLTDTWMWKFGLLPCNSFSGNICFEFSVFVLCSVVLLDTVCSLLGKAEFLYVFNTCSLATLNRPDTAMFPANAQVSILYICTVCLSR